MSTCTTRPIANGQALSPKWMYELEVFADALGVPRNAVRMELSKSWFDDCSGPGILRFTTDDDKTLEIEVDHALVERVADAIGATGESTGFTLTHDWTTNTCPLVTISHWAKEDTIARLFQATQEGSSE